MSAASWPMPVFDRIYARSSDPWNVQSSVYETDKYAATLRPLAGQRFDAALEIGCSIGVMTRALAASCNTLLAIDGAAAALALARPRCADLSHVRFRQLTIPDEWPRQCFDLMVFSEVLYFLDAGDITQTAQRVIATASPSCTLVLANFLGATDTPMTGDSAATSFITATASHFTPILQERTQHYRLDVLQSGHISHA